MAEAEENREKRSFSMQINGFSRDLMNKFMNVGNNLQQGKFQEFCNENEDDDDLELSLGLSLNGRFGVDPQRGNRLKRSSSIANFGDESNGSLFSVGSYVPPAIARTCSLPVEAEEECRKRKELQSLRRLEAKRKRMEKLQNVRVVKDKVDLDESREENGNGYSNGQGQVVNNGNNGNSLPLSQGSMGSQGSGSSGISDFGSQPIQGPGDSTGKNIPTSIKPSEQERERKQVSRLPETTSEKSASTCNGSASQEAKEMFKNYMLNMPCVSTTVDGPNGKRIEGFLYRYRKGEEVKIMCVCHGNFLSPAEFVKHAGGADVANPLRHIVVNPSPLLR